MSLQEGEKHFLGLFLKKGIGIKEFAESQEGGGGGGRLTFEINNG